MWIFYVCKHCKTKTNKTVCGSKKKSWIFKILMKISNFVGGKFFKFWSSINLPTFSEIKDYEISLIFCLIGIQCNYKNTAATWSKDEVHHVLWDYTHTSCIQEFVEHPQYNVEKILNDVALVHLPKNSIPAYTSRKPWK